MPEPTADSARIVTVPSEEAMFNLLSALNVSGVHCELPCAFLAGGGAFIATLTDPDADYVNYVAADESGHSRCVVGCDNCGSDADAGNWKPTYPLLALVAEWPDEKRIDEEDYIDPWWRPQRAPALSPRVCTDPACTIPRKPGFPAHGPHDFRAAEPLNRPGPQVCPECHSNDPDGCVRCITEAES